MTRLLFYLSLIIVALLLFVSGCEKEKIVESTEYIQETEYIELPPDTVLVEVSDTIIQINEVHDTVFVHDTVSTVQNYYDTTVMIDTVLTIQCNPNAQMAFTALQYYNDPMVLEFINQEFGYSDGWIFYLSFYQSNIVSPSTGVYEIYGYIDYWTPDWSGYYPLEFYWSLTFLGDDPANPDNWQFAEPTTVSGNHQPGLKIIDKDTKLEK